MNISMVLNDFSNSSLYYDAILGMDLYYRYSKFLSTFIELNQSILELACGTGLYTIPLKNMGYNIDGLDISENMLQVLKEKNSNIIVYTDDMSDFKLEQKYDCILCLNSSLLLLADIKQIKKTIDLCVQHLNSNGLLFIDIPNHQVEINSEDSQYSQTYNIPDGKLDIVFREYIKGDKWVSNWHGYVLKNNIYSEFSEFYEELIIEIDLLENIFTKKFEIVNIWGSRSGDPFDRNISYRRFYMLRLLGDG